MADIYPPLEGRIPELSAAGTHLNDAGYALVAKVVPAFCGTNGVTEAGSALGDG